MLPIREFELILEELEDIEDVQLYDAAQASNEESILLEEAFKLIEAERFSYLKTTTNDVLE